MRGRSRWVQRTGGFIAGISGPLNAHTIKKGPRKLEPLVQLTRSLSEHVFGDTCIPTQAFLESLLAQSGIFARLRNESRGLGDLFVRTFV